MLRLMETQLGASKAGCSTVSSCRAAIFNRQQKGNNKFFYLALRREKLGVQLPNALLAFIFPLSLGKWHFLCSVGLGKPMVSLVWTGFWVEGLFLWLLLAKGTQAEEGTQHSISSAGQQD